MTAPNWSTSRRSDPQNPSYLVFDDNGKTYEIGQIEGTKSREPPKLPNGVARTFEVTDIIGAKANTKGLGVFEYAKR